jgi:[acyl-carrier-protein] S-malonyltransferase
MGSGVAWLFPGQGSQTVGMGRELAEKYPSAARAFEEANDALGFDLRLLCWEGPQSELDRTANTQPAILTASIAALRAAEEAAGGLDEPVVAMGHSLGEFSALVAAGALELSDAVVLVRRRGELMQGADPSGGMLAVIGLDSDAIATAIAGTGLVVANDNAPGQVVISGPKDGFDRATAALKDAGAKRVIPLRTSAAFHSPAMRPVGPQLAKAIEVTPLGTSMRRCTNMRRISRHCWRNRSGRQYSGSPLCGARTGRARPHSSSSVRRASSPGSRNGSSLMFGRRTCLT